MSAWRRVMASNHRRRTPLRFSKPLGEPSPALSSTLSINDGRRLVLIRMPLGTSGFRSRAGSLAGSPSLTGGRRVVSIAMPCGTTRVQAEAASRRGSPSNFWRAPAGSIRAPRGAIPLPTGAGRPAGRFNALIWYARRDSNPHCRRAERRASYRWATRAWAAAHHRADRAGVT
jgi:hypothetical protein